MLSTFENLYDWAERSHSDIKKKLFALLVFEYNELKEKQGGGGGNIL